MGYDTMLQSGLYVCLKFCYLPHIYQTILCHNPVDINMKAQAL